MVKDTVSIIIPNYNGKAYLKGCLDSILGLDYPKDKIEVILVDNASSDDSVAFTKINYPFVKIIELKENLGYAGGCDIGAQNANSEFIIFLNNDCLLHKDFITELLNTFYSEKNIGAVSSVIYDYTCTHIDFIGTELNFYGHGNQIYFRKPIHELKREDYPDYTISPCGAAMLIPRSTYFNIGGYDTDYFAYFEDVDLGWRLWIMGYKVKLAKNAIVGHIHQGSAKFVGDAVKLRLCERNSLITIIKNYEKENLIRVLGASLFLMFKRTIDDTIINKTSYDVMYSKNNTIDKMCFKNNLKYKLFKGIEKLLKSISKDKNFEFEIISKKSMARLIAISDILENFDKILKKRDFVQSKRKVSDKEIFPLFINPNFVSFYSKEMELLQNTLVDFLEIHKIWS